MRTPLEITSELKHVTYSSQPNIRFHQQLALLNELEASLTHVAEIIEPTLEPEFSQEGQIVLMKDENGVYEEYLVGESVVGEPSTEIPVVKKPSQTLKPARVVPTVTAKNRVRLSEGVKQPVKKTTPKK